jgi:uncharacterized protein (DUF58 family)
MLRSVRRLFALARRAVHNLLGGEYHSVFKGTGLSFDEVRPYAPGDDVRRIDWNVTARMDAPFVKRFIEERERSVLLALDTSASLDFGTASRTKRAAAAELAALLAFSALANNDRVGLLLFSDRLEHFLPPAKGQRHALRVLRDILYFRPQGKATALRVGLDHLNQLVRRRAVVFLLSDFLDVDYERPLRRAARQHDLIAVRLSDPREAQLPAVGLVHWRDAETDQPLLVDTSAEATRRHYAQHAAQRGNQLHRQMHAAGVELLELTPQDNPLQTLVRFFRARQARRRQS